MDKLNFFDVNKDYINYLQQAEISKRGFSRVPNMDYGDKNQKFLCGIVIKSPDTNLDYFVGVTHYPVQKSENFLIVIENDRVPVKGSLRFNFMFPVPEQMLTVKKINNEADSYYRDLLLKEYKYINSKSNEIRSQAENVYHKIINRACSQNLLINSCDFLFLEEKCLQYCRENNLSIPITKTHNTQNQIGMIQPITEKERSPFNDLLVELQRTESSPKRPKSHESER